MAAYKKDLRLYLDESGVPELLPHDRYYTLCGVVVNSIQSNLLKIKADQIKFKYWGDTKIVFHSREIGLKLSNFEILDDPITERNFLKDIYAYLHGNGYKLIIVSVDKQASSALGWTPKDVQDKATDAMIEAFLMFLNFRDAHGQIIMESSGGRDVAFYKRYSYYLSQGLPSQNLTHFDVKNLITSITFASKKNHDIETQIADIFAYPASRQCAHDDGHALMTSPSYEENVCQYLAAKLADIENVPAFFRLP